MLEILFKTIPKGVNELYWYLCLIGIAFLFRNRTPQKNIIARYLVLLFVFSIIWRVLYGISSARYALNLVYYSIVFLAFGINELLHTNKKAIAIIVATGLAFLVLHDSFFDIEKDDYIYYAISSAIKRIDRNPNEHCFYIVDKDYYRIRYLSKVENTKKIRSQEINEIDEIIDKKKIAYIRPVVVRVASKKERSYNTSIYEPNSTNRKIISLNRGDKEFFIYRFPTGITCYPVSGVAQTNNDNYVEEINMTMEYVDSDTESFQKLSKNIRDYSSVFDISNSYNRTPRNGYFHTTTKLKEEDVFTVTDIDSIQGNSVYIKKDNGPVYFFSEKKLQNGNYICSLYIKGKPGTNVKIVYTPNIWSPQILADFVIPDKRVFYLETSFSVSSITKPGYFILGTVFWGGEVYYDNILLKRVESL